MEQNYETEVVVVIDGEEIAAYARFTVSADSVPKWWAGTLESEDSALAFKLVNGSRTTLRLADGKEGTIIPVRGAGVAFRGSGQPPT